VAFEIFPYDKLEYYGIQKRLGTTVL